MFADHLIQSIQGAGRVQFMGSGLKRRGQSVVGLLIIVMLLFGFFGAADSDIACAKTDYSPPATELKVTLNDNGKVRELATFTISELQQMSQVQAAYSSMDRMPAPNITAAQGIMLKDFLKRLNVDIDSIEKFKFKATDGYVMKITKDELMDTPRYYFPKINECFDQETYPEFKAGAEDGKTRVEPMLALQSYQERFLDRPEYGQMDGTTTIRLCLGQQTVSECTNYKMVRWMQEMEITGSLEASAYTGKVELSTPIGGQVYQAGVDMKIEGTASNLQNVTINVIAPDGHTAYTAKNIEVVSGAFSTDFTLENDMAAGSYTIKVSAGQLATDYTRSFTVGNSNAVTSPEARVTLSTPSEGQSYQSGDQVSIAGTVGNLESVAIDVIAPDGQTVFSEKNLDAQSGSFKTDFALKQDAADGKYIIKIGSSLLSSDCTVNFVVAKPAEKVTQTDVTPVENKIPASGNVKTFTDLQNHWAQKVIMELTARGIVSGVTENEFKPDAYITRAQFTVMLAKALNIDTSQGGSGSFRDVPDSAWCHNAVNAAVAAGLISGYSNDVFGPDDVLTREQMTVIIGRALLIKQPLSKPSPEVSTVVLGKFTDKDDIAAWAKPEVALLDYQGIVSGKQSDRFIPRDKATRAEAAVMISHLLAAL